MIDWLLLDYGKVLSKAQPESTFTELAAIADSSTDEFRERYWRYRAEYDRGQTAERYWSAVLGRDLAGQRSVVERLTAIDVDGWSHLNLASLRTTLSTARRNDLRLALLSNAPHAQAAAIDASDWIRHFDHRFYSCRLQRIKPDPAIFAEALSTIGTAPERVLFIDDRAENTSAAADLGMAAITFTSARALRHQLARTIS